MESNLIFSNSNFNASNIFKNIGVKMKLNRILFVVLFLIAVFALASVSASEDVSIDNLTIDEVNDSISIDEIEESDVLESNQDNEILSDKQDSGMEVEFVDENKNPCEYMEFLVSDYDEYFFAVKFPSKVPGKLSLFIDDKLMAEKNITSKTHYFHVNTPDYKLASGKHTAKIIYSGGGNYSQATWTGNYELIPYDIIYDGNILYGTTEFFGIYIDKAVGDVIATVDGKRYSAPLVRGNAFITLPALSIGEHNVHIDYSGDKNHVSRSIDATFTVSASICGPEYRYPFNEDTEISLQLPGNANGNLVVTIDGKEIGNVKLVNGFAKVSLPKYNDLEEDHEVHAEYTGNDYPIWDYDNYELYRGPSVNVEPDMILNKEYTLSFEVPSKYSGTLTVYVPGYSDSFKTNVVNGKASIKFLAKESGYVSWVFEDISGYYDDDGVDVFVGPNPNMAVSVDSKVGANPVFKVNVANDAGGAITVTINGKEYDSSYFTGKGSLTIPGLADGTYKAVVTYSGDYKYPAVSKTITFKKTSKEKVSLTLKKVKVKKSAKKLVLTATLKINKKAAKGKTIKFKFNKKTFKAKTNKKGVAKVTIKKKFLKKLKVGKKVKIQASYGKTVKKLTVKVKK